MLFFQMHKRTSDLDEAFVEEVIAVGALEPEMFQNIMRLIVVAGVEAGEISGVTGMEVRGRGDRKGVDVGGNAIALFHRIDADKPKPERVLASSSPDTWRPWARCHSLMAVVVAAPGRLLGVPE